MTTVKELIEILTPYAKNEDAKVMNHENADFVHIVNKSNGDVILTTEKPIGYCNRSSGYVYPTSVEDYVGVSTELDENVDLCEMILPILEDEENPNKFGEAVERKSKYKEPFYLLLDKVKDTLPQEVWEELYKFDVSLDS